jgi:hypothetical protein
MALRGFVGSPTSSERTEDAASKAGRREDDARRLGSRVLFSGGPCLAEAAAAAILRSPHEGVMKRQNDGWTLLLILRP